MASLLNKLTMKEEKYSHHPLLNQDEEDGDVSRSSSDHPVMVYRGQSSKLNKAAAFLVSLALLLSVGLNALLLGGRRTEAPVITYSSGYSGIPYDSLVTYQGETEYIKSDNHSNALWDAIDIQGVVASISDKQAKQLNLPPTQKFPWDDERSLYYVKGLHQMHCLKLIRHALVRMFDGKDSQIEHPHLLHCMDALRQDIMCYADDTLMPWLAGQHIGANQPLVCRDWDKLNRWAKQDEWEACWDIGDDYQPSAHFIERFQYCPEDSPYRPTMEKYFEIHGHQKMYKDPGQNLDGPHD